MNEAQLNPQDLIDALVEQRNEAMNALAQMKAVSAGQEKRIEELEEEVTSLRASLRSANEAPQSGPDAV